MNMDKLIQIKVREVYGVAKVYPVNAQAKLLAEIAGTKTLTHGALTRAERMGFQIVQQDQVVPWQTVKG
jgi:hypothetical protein